MADPKVTWEWTPEIRDSGIPHLELPTYLVNFLRDSHPKIRASYDDGPARTPQERLGMLWGEGGTGTDEELAAYAVLSDLLGGGGTQETEGVDG